MHSVRSAPWRRWMNVVLAPIRAQVERSFGTLKDRRGRHFPLFHVRDEAGGSVIDVLRVLHDAMDLARPPLRRSR
jgi:plasmid stabilization system protein ParE